MGDAAPKPPPHLYPVSKHNVPHAGAQPSRLPYIKDLVRAAERRVKDVGSPSVERYLNIADIALQQAGFYFDLGRLDQAYVEYVVAYSILLDLLPRQTPGLVDRPALAKRTQNLQTVSQGPCAHYCRPLLTSVAHRGLQRRRTNTQKCETRLKRTI